MERVGGTNFRARTEKVHGPTAVAVESLLRIHFLQQWFGLSDLAMEEALFEVSLYRDFAGLGSTEQVPDRVSILRFRHLLEAHDLGQQILASPRPANCAW